MGFVPKLFSQALLPILMLSFEAHLPIIVHLLGLIQSFLLGSSADITFYLGPVSKLLVYCSAKFCFSPFSRLYGPLDGFLSQIWSYFELSLALDPTPFALGSATLKCLLTLDPPPFAFGSALS